MPKMKSNRAAAKRYRVTGTGKVIRNQAKKRHMLTAKTSKVKRHLGGSVVIKTGDARRARRLLGM
jgi:large subunit ribosomal protein L35